MDRRHNAPKYERGQTVNAVKILDMERSLGYHHVDFRKIAQNFYIGREINWQTMMVNRLKMAET